jgi:ParB family transcriptional regulator, chromosome partitioning protein
MSKSGSDRNRRGILDLFSWAVNWADDNESRLIILSLDEIIVDNHQPRRHFEKESLQQLARSIRANGVIEPVLVRKLSNGSYQLIAGERRWRAARLAGSSEIPAIVSTLARESDVKKFQLIENLMRRDLNPVEEVNAYLDLLAARLADSPQGKEMLSAGLSQRRVKLAEMLRVLAKEQSKSSAQRSLSSKQSALIDKISKVFNEIGHTSWQDFVKRQLQVLSLPAEVLEALIEGWMSYEEARALSRISDRSLGATRAKQERQRLLAWIKRKEPTLAEIRARIAERRRELTPVNTVPRTRSTRLNEIARLLKTKQLPDRLNHRLEKALSNLESLISEIERE